MDALAAMQADIEALEKLEKWRIHMKLDEDSKEYKKMKKALLKDSQNRLTKGPGARSKAKGKSLRLKWPTKSERTAAIKADDWDKKQWRRSRNKYPGHGHPIERARTPLPRRAARRAASL
jgi:hypothetical protein